MTTRRNVLQLAAGAVLAALGSGIPQETLGAEVVEDAVPGYIGRRQGMLPLPPRFAIRSHMAIVEKANNEMVDFYSREIVIARSGIGTWDISIYDHRSDSFSYVSPLMDGWTSAQVKTIEDFLDQFAYALTGRAETYPAVDW